MSISHLSLVNQKLAHAGAIISLLNESQSRQKLERQALFDAAVFHLQLGLHFYLRELADYHRIKNLSKIDSVQGLLLAMHEADRVSSEASELASLSEVGDSWLSQLSGAYAQLFKSPEKAKEKKAFGHEGLIELREVDENAPIVFSPEHLDSWLNSFKALVIRQRNTCAEY
jgi:hypothetical protein